MQIKHITAAVFLALIYQASHEGRPMSTQQQRVASPAVRCGLEAWVNDDDPQGLNVRSGPGREFPVIATIPRHNGSPGEHPSTETLAILTGATGRWVQIVRAQDHEAREVFRGRGWVFAPLLGVQVTAGVRELTNENYPVEVYRRPDKKGGMIGRIPAQTDVRLQGCQGEWVHIEHKGVKGWLPEESYCANPGSVCIN